MPYTDDFPDFDPATMPQIPLGFEDVSSHEHACPTFWHRELDLTLQVDYADPALRERADSLRFSVFAAGAFLLTDVWDDITEYINRRRFNAAAERRHAENG